MTIDVIDLRDFYSQRLGIVARRLINRGIHGALAGCRRASACSASAIPRPISACSARTAERCIAFMPAAQGVLKWPTARPALATLVDEFSLPLPDAAVDRILLVHALEMSDDPEGLLREVWRVLAPSGRMMAVIPNRRGVWTRTDTTPFGHGRPYSRSQITQLLRQTWFTPTAWGEALFMPPVAGGWFLRSAMAWERAGAALSLPFAGVHIVEATKQVYRAIPAHRERTRLIPALPPVLVPSSLQRDVTLDHGRQGAVAPRPIVSAERRWARRAYRRARMRATRWPCSPPKSFGLLVARIEIVARRRPARAMPSGRGPCGRRRRRGGKRSPPLPSNRHAAGPPLICGCGPVMNDGRRSTLTLSGITGCGCGWGCG